MSAPHAALRTARFLFVDAASFYAAAPPRLLFDALDDADAIVVAARNGVDPRHESQRKIRENRVRPRGHQSLTVPSLCTARGTSCRLVLALGSPEIRRAGVGGAPTAAAVLFQRGPLALRTARLLADAAGFQLSRVAAAAAGRSDNATNDSALAAADGDVLLACAVSAAAPGMLRGVWGCNERKGRAARRALRFAGLREDEAPALRLLDAEVVTSHEHPAILGGGTVVVHVRGGADDLVGDQPVGAGARGSGDCTTPYASIARFAKELGLWEGASDEFGNANYYETGGPRKYVAAEDSVFATLPPDFHAGDKLALVALNLAVVA